MKIILKVFEKVSNIIKKINGELIHNKKYQKTEKKIDTNESFRCFYIPVILIDSVFRTIILKCF